MQIRLQKYLSQAGIASRRASEYLILQGLVKVNGKIINTLGTKVNPKTDIIEVNGKKCNIKHSSIYIIMNKPKGVLTTVKDPFGRPNVIDLLTTVNERVFPVGRLDKETEGLLLLTNDGVVTNKLTHPKYGIEKTYIAHVRSFQRRKHKGIRKGYYSRRWCYSSASVRIIKMLKESTVLEIKILKVKATN